MLGRTVLDTDVLVAAVRSDRGASRVLLTAALGRRYRVLASVPLMLQYESGLTRPEHLAAAHEEAKKVAKAEGVAVNQLINVAVAEKVSALRTEEYFAERAAKGDIKKALQVLRRAGRDNTPVPGDELPVKTRRRQR